MPLASVILSTFHTLCKILEALGCNEMVAPISDANADRSSIVISRPGALRAIAADMPAIPPPLMMIRKGVDDDILSRAW
jgi:hypothetical protein